MNDNGHPVFGQKHFYWKENSPKKAGYGVVIVFNLKIELHDSKLVLSICLKYVKYVTFLSDMSTNGW